LQQASPSLGFAAGHTIEVLRGKLTPNIERFRHAEVSTFGIGSDLSEVQWRSVLRALIAQTMIEVDSSAFNALHVSPIGRDFLKSPVPLLLRQSLERSERMQSSKQKKSSNNFANEEASSALPNQGQRMLKNLKVWRAAVAKEHNLPAYVIFHDATLLAIATLEPLTLDDLATVSGMGVRKLATYGPDVLRILDSQRD
jgi:ATP-dependent DNA helicase RecQ